MLRNLFTRQLSPKQIENLYIDGKFQEIVSKVNFDKISDYKTIQLVAHSNFELKNYEIAFKQYRKALAVLSNQPYLKNEVRMNIAFSYYNKGDYNNAISYIQEIESDYFADKMKFGDYRLAKVLGDSFVEIGKVEIALEAYKKAPLNKKEINHDLKEILYSVAEAYELIGNFKQAIKYFNKVLSVDFNYLDTNERITKLEKKSE